METIRSHWRDSAGWKAAGLPLTTTSDEACKLYDAAITQYVGWYDDPALGGLSATVSKIRQADPDFVMGQVLETGLTLIGTGESVSTSEVLRKDVARLAAIAKEGCPSRRERLHVDAVLAWSRGRMSRAAALWEDILIDDPTDILALKLAHDSYFYLGLQRQMRDSVARVLPRWKKSTPLYSYLHGMLAFGLCETNLYDRARKSAELALQMNRNDAWATHAMAHVYEMQADPDGGIAFMSRTLGDWEPCGMLACHNFWHWAVFHVEKGEREAALDLFDGQMIRRLVSSGAMLDYVDASSLLYRLQLGADVKEDLKSRWPCVWNAAKPHLNDRILVFNQLHFLMACLGVGASTDQLLAVSTSDMSGKGEDDGWPADQQLAASQVGLPVMQAMVAHSEGRFGDAAEQLAAVRYDVLRIGGSDAQRDVFDLLLLDSAMRSDRHNHLAEALLAQRSIARPKSPMLQTMAETFSRRRGPAS
ncbi:tetratricopeptide repeat protein 38 [Ixodes scapularis]|uniref:tetratricopeptide repeat protein 38 n=1 Tax=Ixodes scapularis TaxID=6945 RepID=UPI001A9DC64F|nr:tetratricopeptide repeat protein 38 [Ixodes scapularis]